MTLYIHELKQARKNWIIWTLAIAAFMVMCVLLYPEISVTFWICGRGRYCDQQPGSETDRPWVLHRRLRCCRRSIVLSE